MNIDRKTLRVTEPAYLELQQAVHAHLRTVISQARDKLYRVGSDERKRTRAATAVEDIRRLAAEVAPADKQVAREMVAAWTKTSSTDASPARLLRKYSVVELYEIVIEVARTILTKGQVAQFVKLLTDRLSK